MVDLEMNLQMVSKEIAASLEEQSASALLCVPRATRDVLHLVPPAIPLLESSTSSRRSVVLIIFPSVKDLMSISCCLDLEKVQGS
ncbi:hypothetical protein SLEP1_g45928 [Rubroshorea leprosula]|uniref:Uncharacterized protein n=1 Tax=Rubroshorea leprosula TaxID=152421 RepID=A0AAV5LKQ4_9ROSI|nr:hypothetical protein SLEP1_g45928 [Rubroshorea leprosula]